MKYLLSKILFIALLCGTTITANAQVNFDLVIIFKPTTTWADIIDFKAQLRATQLDSTLPSGAKFWRCSIPAGTIITLPNAGGGRSTSVTPVAQPSDAVGVICGTGSTDGVSLNGVYVIPEGDQQIRGDTSRLVPPALFANCPSPSMDSIIKVGPGDRPLKIAILDSGIDYDKFSSAIGDKLIAAHDSIRAYINTSNDAIDGRDDDNNGYVDDYIGYDFVNKSGYPQDSTGHGTFVTGVIARILKRNVATSIKIYILKVLNGQNRGYEYDIIRAIDYSIKNKVEVINCSFISSMPTTDTTDLPLASAIATAQRSGVLVSMAAGNNGKNIDNLPNLYTGAAFQNPNLIVTGASSCLDSTASFSNFAKRNVDIITPAKGLVSAWIRTSVCGSSTCYAFNSGTSFAAPQTTAVAAILSSRLVAADWQRVKCSIMKGSTYRPFLLNQSRRSSTLNAVGASNILNLTNTPCDELINSTGRILENITTFKAYPNPFTTAVNIGFSLKETANVQISVYNSTGQRLVNQSFTAISGDNQVPLSIEAVSGVYIVQIKAGNDVVNQKIVKF
jgi:subtilisin family serine protease